MDFFVSLVILSEDVGVHGRGSVKVNRGFSDVEELVEAVMAVVWGHERH